MKPTRFCKTPGCSRPVTARGMCQRCYNVAYRAGEIQPELKVGIHSLTDIDIEAKTAVCAICGPTRIRVRGGKRGHECESKRGRPVAVRASTGEVNYSSLDGPARWMWDKYKISPDRYAQMWIDQDGDCAICGEHRELVVDHCHDTGRVRGLLCHRCNVALGWMNDQPENLRRAASYLEQD